MNSVVVYLYSLLMVKLQRPPMETASPTSSSSSPMGSEMGTPSSSMGVQDYRRLFIKEGLKMKVQQKIGSKKLEVGGRWMKSTQ